MSRNTEFCLTNDLPSSGPRSYEHSHAKDREGVKSSLPKILKSTDRSGADDIQRLLCQVILVKKMDHSRCVISVNTDTPAGLHIT